MHKKTASPLIDWNIVKNEITNAINNQIENGNEKAISAAMKIVKKNVSKDATNEEIEQAKEEAKKEAIENFNKYRELLKNFSKTFNTIQEKVDEYNNLYQERNSSYEALDILSGKYGINDLDIFDSNPDLSLDTNYEHLQITHRNLNTLHRRLFKANSSGLINPYDNLTNIINTNQIDIDKARNLLDKFNQNLKICSDRYREIIKSKTELSKSEKQFKSLKSKFSKDISLKQYLIIFYTLTRLTQKNTTNDIPKLNMGQLEKQGIKKWRRIADIPSEYINIIIENLDTTIKHIKSGKGGFGIFLSNNCNFLYHKKDTNCERDFDTNWKIAVNGLKVALKKHLEKIANPCTDDFEYLKPIKNVSTDNIDAFNKIIKKSSNKVEVSEAIEELLSLYTSNNGVAYLNGLPRGSYSVMDNPFLKEQLQTVHEYCSAENWKLFSMYALKLDREMKAKCKTEEDMYVWRCIRYNNAFRKVFADYNFPLINGKIDDTSTLKEKLSIKKMQKELAKCPKLKLKLYDYIKKDKHGSLPPLEQLSAILKEIAQQFPNLKQELSKVNIEDTFRSLPSIKDELIKRLKKISNKKPTIVEKGFLSTTTVEGGLKNFGSCVFKIFVPKGSHGADIIALGTLTEYPGECEIIFPRNTALEISEAKLSTSLNSYLVPFIEITATMKIKK